MQKLIDSYLNNQLSPEQLAQFEAQLLHDGDLLDELIAAEKLREGMQIVAHETPEVFTQTQVQDNRFGTTSSTSNSWFKFAMAAAITGMIVLPNAMMYTKMQSAQDDLVALQAMVTPQVNMPEAVISAMRSSNTGDLTTLVFDQQNNWQRLTIELSPPTLTTYSVAIVDTQGNSTITFDDVAPSSFDSISLSLPSSALVEGDYVVKVFATDTTNPLLIEHISITHR